MERPIDVNLSSSTNTRIGQDTKDIEQTPTIELTQEDIDPDVYKEPTVEDRQRHRARLAQVLDRGLTVDLLNVNLPNHLESRWEANDALSLASAELRGFKVDTQFATRNGLHGTGDGKGKIADVIHMIRPMWMKEDEDALKAQRYHENHIADKRKQKEERDFLAQNELQPIVNSRMTEVSGAQIEESLSTKK